jgi:ubiquinone/menaquinone biosynthesis C-methylase UbiE
MGKKKVHTCPLWAGYLLVCPLRRLIQNPEKILSPYVKPGMKVLDIGPGMGFFSLPMARMVGESGKVFCVDIQEGMLSALMKRAEKEGLDKRIEPVLISPGTGLPLPDEPLFDFCLAFAVLHEVAEKELIISEISRRMKQGGLLCYAEPKGHVKKRDFEATLRLLEKAGFVLKERPKVMRSHAAMLILPVV